MFILVSSNETEKELFPNQRGHGLVPCFVKLMGGCHAPVLVFIKIFSRLVVHVQVPDDGLDSPLPSYGVSHLLFRRPAFSPGSLHVIVC